MNLEGHTDTVSSVCISPDEKILASGSCKAIKLWSIESGKEISPLKGIGHSHFVKSVQFSPD